MTVVFVGSLILLWLCQAQLKSLERRGFKKRPTYHFLEHTREFIGVLACVLLFYNALLFLVSVGWKVLSVRRLMWLEEHLLAVRTFVGALQLTWTSTLAILVGLYFLGFTRSRRFQTDRRFLLFKKAKAVLKTVYVAVVLLCCFTLLGTQAGDLAATLEIRLRTDHNHFGVLRQEVRKALADQTANELYGHVREHLGSGVQRASEALNKLQENATVLRNSYIHFRQSYKGRVVEIETAIDRQGRRANLDPNIRLRGQAPDTSRASATQTETDAPSKASYDSIEDARSAVAKYREKISPEVIKLLARPGGKDIILHLPNLFSEKISDMLLDPFVEQYPFLKPVIEIFSATFDDAVEEKVEKGVDALTESAVSTPDELEEKVQSAAKKIADSTPVHITPGEARELSQAVRQLENEAGNLNLLHSRLEKKAQTIENGTTEKLIAQLQSDDRATRERAAEELSQRGDRLNREHVGRLVEMMRNGEQEWETNAEREGHCWNYEYTSERYYAARALEGLQSPFIDNSISQEIREAKQGSVRSERVTDPGWI